MAKRATNKVELGECSGMMRKAESISGFPTSSLSGDFAANPSLMSNPEVEVINKRTDEEVESQKKAVKELVERIGNQLYQLRLNPQQPITPINPEGVKIDIIVNE